MKTREMARPDTTPQRWLFDVPEKLLEVRLPMQQAAEPVAKVPIARA
ncbi:MAG: hypothetical protein Q7V88_17715 [Actinomycetota bacterium]|nr:hypothetical protein [Actinomycetota bacterium]